MHHASGYEEQKLAPQNPGILSAVPTPSRFDSDEHRITMRSHITAAQRTLRTSG